MVDTAALRIAVELIHMPSRARALRHEPLPDGIPTVLRIAAGDQEAIAEASRLLDRPRQVIREAAVFYIEQVLLAPDADSYRVLGASRMASNGDLRRNMALLLKWLHPDVERAVDRSALAGRVTSAWEQLKTADKRSAYDLTLARVPAAHARVTPATGSGKAPVRQRLFPGIRRHGLHKSAGVRSAQLLQVHARDGRGLWRRALNFLLGQGRR